MLWYLSLDNFNDYKSYTDFIKSHPKVSYFHSTEFFLALKSTPGIIPLSIIVVDDNNKIKAILLGEISNESSFLPFFTRRLIIHANPLYCDIHYLELIVRKLISRKYGLFIQIRTLFGFEREELSVYNKYGFVFNDHLSSTIPIKNVSIESLVRDFKKDKIKGIKQAINKFNLTIEEYDDIELSIEEFYRMISILYNKKRHTLKSKQYFFNLVKHSNNQIKIAFALYNNIPIAAQLYSEYDYVLTALYAATLNEFKDKHGGDYLIFYLLDKCIKSGKHLFDFGGGGNPNVVYKPREYKARFGTVFNNVGRLVLPQSLLYSLVISI